MSQTPVQSTFLDIPKPPELTWRVQSTQRVAYQVCMVQDLLSPSNPSLASALSEAPDLGCRVLVVMDETVSEIYGSAFTSYFSAWRIQSATVQQESGEEHKTLDSAVRVASAMDEMGILRRTEKVLAVGGGVVMDVVGLAASLFRRGVPVVKIPTTLLGQIDAGIGVKTGVNHGTHKNRLGTYSAPECSLIDPAFLSTLPSRHLINGMAEIIKMALVKDDALFSLLEANIEEMNMHEAIASSAGMLEAMSRSIAGMLSELEANLWESVLERAVDYGHTFSPSLELRADPPMLHGEAVAVDMALCLALAHLRGYLSASDTRRALDLIRRTGLPVTHEVFTEQLLSDALKDSVRHRDGSQRIPLTTGIGQVTFVNDLTAEDLRGALSIVHDYAFKSSSNVSLSA